jgi:hypothetical protein
MQTTRNFIQGITRYCGPKIICKKYSIEWQNRLRLQNLPGKGHAYMPYTIETGEPSRPYNTLEWTHIEDSRHTQNTGAYTGQTINIETTQRNSESKMQQETEPFKTSGGNPIGGRINQPY